MSGRNSLGVYLLAGSMFAALAALILPGGVAVGVPVRGYVLFLFSFGSLAGPFGGWQDIYMALSSFVNIALYFGLPIAAIRRWRLRSMVVVAGLSAAYVALFAAILLSGVLLPVSYYAWLLSAVLAACGLWMLMRFQQSEMHRDEMPI